MATVPMDSPAEYEEFREKVCLASPRLLVKQS